MLGHSHNLHSIHNPRRIPLVFCKHLLCNQDYPDIHHHLHIDHLHHLEFSSIGCFYTPSLCHTLNQWSIGYCKGELGLHMRIRCKLDQSSTNCHRHKILQYLYQVRHKNLYNIQVHQNTHHPVHMTHQ